MSDVSQGEGWWVASDGRWYAPELHPDWVAPSADPLTTPTPTPATIAAAPVGAGAGQPPGSSAPPRKPERIIPLDAAPAKLARRSLRAPKPKEAPAPEPIPVPMTAGFVDGTHLLGTSVTAPGASRRAATDTLGASSYGGSSVGTDPTAVHNPRGFSIVMAGVIVLVLAVGGLAAHHFLTHPDPHRSAVAVASDFVVQFYGQNQKALNADKIPGQHPPLTVYEGVHPPGASVLIRRTSVDHTDSDTNVSMWVCFNLSGSPCNAQQTGAVPGVIPTRKIHGKWYVDESAINECFAGSIVCYNDNA